MQANIEQAKAIKSLDGYNFVLAGAGSGKTHVLISRIAYMLQQGIDPSSILLITFTNKAAKEMKDRVMKLLGDDKGAQVTACTFHSFCANVLRKYAKFVGMANDFIVLDDADRQSAMDIAKEEYFEFCDKRQIPVDTDEFPSSNQILHIYEMVTNKGVSIQEAVPKQFAHLKDDIAEVIPRFVKYKKEHGAMDYDDLLVYTERLFRQNANIRAEYDKKYRYIMCDEYQDTNPIQNSIINLISQDYPNLMVVGDDNQSIYAFRYADVQNILSFKDVHAGCKEFMLVENYRSTQEILDAANAIMAHATEGIEKKLHGQRHGSKPEIIECQDRYTEAEWILRDIMRRNVPLHEVAVMCRGGQQTYILEAQLNKLGVPFNKYGGTKFMDKAVIKDLLAFLRALHNYKDEIAMTRILQMFPGVGIKSAKKLTKQIAENGLDALLATEWSKKAFFASLVNIHDVLQYLSTLTLHDQIDYLVHDYYYILMEDKINQSHKKNKQDDFQKLRDSVEDAEALMEMTASYTSISSFLADVVLEATHKNEDVTDKLNITTIHSAKGLQYHTVYLMDCIEGMTPRCSKHSPEDPEELRCMYVAITRAKERLVLMKPRYTFDSNRSIIPTSLSHFLDYNSVYRTLDARCVN